MRLQNYTKPDKIKVYEAEIDGLEEAKEEAIKREAYEKAGEIKKKQEKIREKIAQTMESGRRTRRAKSLLSATMKSRTWCPAGPGFRSGSWLRRNQSV